MASPEQTLPETNITPVEIPEATAQNLGWLSVNSGDTLVYGRVSETQLPDISPKEATPPEPPSLPANHNAIREINMATFAGALPRREFVPVTRREVRADKKMSRRRNKLLNTYLKQREEESIHGGFDEYGKPYSVRDESGKRVMQDEPGATRRYKVRPSDLGDREAMKQRHETEHYSRRYKRTDRRAARRWSAKERRLNRLRSKILPLIETQAIAPEDQANHRAQQEREAPADTFQWIDNTINWDFVYQDDRFEDFSRDVRWLASMVEHDLTAKQATRERGQQLLAESTIKSRARALAFRQLAPSHLGISTEAFEKISPERELEMIEQVKANLDKMDNYVYKPPLPVRARRALRQKAAETRQAHREGLAGTNVNDGLIQRQINRVARGSGRQVRNSRNRKRERAIRQAENRRGVI